MTGFQYNASLKPFNTFGVEARAGALYPFRNLEELLLALEKKERSRFEELLILGEGSNILLTGDYPGLVLKNDLKGIEVLEEDDDHFWVKVMAGENWHRFVLYCLDHGWAGVENLSLIPGTVGAAPMQNIGAYGVEIKSVFEALEAVEIDTGKIRNFTCPECRFDYRESIFKKEAKGRYIITSVTLKLNRHPEFNISYGTLRDTLKEMGVEALSIKKVSDAVIRIRQSKLPNPSEIGNAGSFFKNPTIDMIDYEGLKAEFSSVPGFKQAGEMMKVPAAWLIEQAGWKGRTFGPIGVHKDHPLVLVNYGGGKGEAIKKLADAIQASVAEKFGIELTPEVNII